MRGQPDVVTAADLTGDTADLQSAFQKLGQGPIVTQNVILYSQADQNQGFPDYRISMDDAFLQFLNVQNGGQFVLSFVLPFIPETRDFGDTYHLISLQGALSLETQLSFYEPNFSAVPEPSTYGIAATLLLLGLSASRRRLRGQGLVCSECDQ